MVRAQGKQTNEERKEGKKKTSNGSAKKKPETGSWPCKMDGCKKVFAREADLKRHQRTTKTHSIPGFQCPQCDATFTRTDALRRHQKSRHNGVVIEPTEDKEKHTGDGASSGSRSPSPGGSPSRSHGEGSMNGSPPATQSSAAGSSGGPSSYYRPHTMQDGGSYYAGYPPPPRPPPGMMIDPQYPPPPIGLPTSATRSNQTSWQPAPAAPPWGPEGHPMAPPPGMYMPSYYPSPYYRHPGMPLPPHPSHFPPQINPELMSQSNGQMSGVVAPESALRNTSPEKPDGTAQGKQDAGAVDMAGQSSISDARGGESMRTTQMQGADGAKPDGEEEPDASTLMAAAALQAVLAFQKEHEMKEAASRRGSTAPDGAAPTQSQAEMQTSEATMATSAPAQSDSSDALYAGLQVLANASDAAGPSVPAPSSPQTEPNANGAAATSAPATNEMPISAQPPEAGDDVKPVEPPSEPTLDPALAPAPEAPSQPMEQLMTEDGMPMLNPAELLTQVWAGQLS
ncbi:hypothetical protein PYCCODRAFT_553975 [Trametes coccinea BRFM310]|uniref:C2H2-type domain-containing protein n=1 Tax=Trametes coccinea (strain BRFM310) TaxID=1353009 RepID=A0A1Y2IJ92_TRAC3|nr:hypothetical protein PYCCODRAFT_553975 [Trametes coccinea BRFM310]